MAKDFTKYKVKDIDGTFGKSKLVLAILKHYCSLMNPSFEDLKKDFPDELQGKGVFTTIEEANKIAKTKARHYVNDPIKIKDATISVSNQWGTQIDNFISKAKEIGYDISNIEGDESKSTPKPLINQINDFFRKEEFEEMRTFFEELDDDEWDKVDSEIGKLLKDDPKYFFVGIIFESIDGANFDIGSFLKGTGELVERFTIEKDPDKLCEKLEEKPLLKIIIEKYGFSNNKIKQDNVDFKLLFSAYFISNLEVIIKTDDYENLHIIADFIINQSLYVVREFDIDDTYGDWIADFTLNIIAAYTGVKISEYEGEYYSGRYFSYSAEMGYDYETACADIINAIA